MLWVFVQGAKHKFFLPLRVWSWAWHRFDLTWFRLMFLLILIYVNWATSTHNTVEDQTLAEVPFLAFAKKYCLDVEDQGMLPTGSHHKLKQKKTWPCKVQKIIIIIITCNGRRFLMGWTNLMYLRSQIFHTAKQRAITRSQKKQTQGWALSRGDDDENQVYLNCVTPVAKGSSLQVWKAKG